VLGNDKQGDEAMGTMLIIGRRIAASAVFAAGAILGLAKSAHAVTPTAQAPTDFTVEPGQTLHRTLDCGTGNKAISGGVLTSTPFTRVWRSFPDSTHENFWHISVTSTNSVSEKVWARALCATGFASYDVFTGSTKSFASGTFESGAAGCGENRMVIGGGFSAPNANFVIVSSHIGGNGWNVRALNDSGVTNQVSVLATCSGSLSVASNNPLPVRTTVTPGSSVFPSMTCPTGTWLGSGGFKSTVDTPWTTVPGSLTDGGVSIPSTWKWNLKNQDKVSRSYERFIRCFDF
jgi:hypothetical protein